MHQFHYDCIIGNLINQVDIYFQELFKRRKEHQNDTISQVSKPLSNKDAVDPE